MAQEPENLYEKIWGEPPPAPPPADLLTAGEPPNPRTAWNPSSPSYGREPEGNGAPVSREPLIPSRPIVRTATPSVQPPPQKPIPETRNTALLQHQMAETLRRVEARLGELTQQVQPYTQSNFQESVRAVQDISVMMSKATAELDGLIDYSRMIVQELADIQAESRRGLAVIYEKLRELDRPRKLFGNS